MKKTILPLCAALLLTAGLVSCGEGGATPTTGGQTQGRDIYLSVWVPQEQVEWAEGRIEEFKAANAHTGNTYNITVTRCKEGDVQTQIANDPTASADVFFFAGDHLGPLVDSQFLYEWPSAWNNEAALGISESVLSSARVNGKLYGIPYTPNSYFLYYNSDKVTEDDVKSLDALLEKGEVLFDVANGWYQTAFWYGTGVRFFGDEGTDPEVANLDSEEGYAAARAIRDYTMHPNFVYGSADDIPAKFTADSNVVAAVCGNWISNNLITNLGQSLHATTLPTFQEGNTTYHLTATGDWKKCGVSNFTAEPAEAVKLAVWLTNSDSMLEKLSLFNETPVLTSLATHEDVLGNEIVKALMDQTSGAHCVRQPSIGQMANWWSAAESFGKAIITARDGDVEAGTGPTAFTDEQCMQWAKDLQVALLKTI